MISPVDTGKAWEECRCPMMYFSSKSRFLSLGFEQKLRMRAYLYLSPAASNSPVLVRLTHRRSSDPLKGIFIGAKPHRPVETIKAFAGSVS